MRCTEVADRPFPDGQFFGRDIGDLQRSSTKDHTRLRAFKVDAVDGMAD